MAPFPTTTGLDMDSPVNQHEHPHPRLVGQYQPPTTTVYHVLLLLLLLLLYTVIHHSLGHQSL